MEPSQEIIQYILESQSFNEPDIAFIMHSMFKGIYKTDSKGQWYSLNADGTWILKDTFDVRDLIGSVVCNTIVKSVNLIKNHPGIYKRDTANRTERYDVILKNLGEKRQLLRDQNRINEECLIKEHIRRVTQQRDSIEINRNNFTTFDPMTVVRSLRTRSFVDRVMEEVTTLFVQL